MPPLPLAFAEGDRRSSDSRYFFYKDGVKYQTAFDDRLLCEAYSHTVALIAKPSDFIPVGTSLPSTGNKDNLSASDASFRVLGPFLGFLSATWLEGVMEEANMRHCMFYKGYKRYAVSAAAYRAITKGEKAEQMGRAALVASGPTPQSGEVEP